MKKCALAFCSLIYSLLLFSQYKVEGSIVVAVICKDGIVIGADSRATFVDDNGIVLGYTDGMQKIFTARNFVMASTGLISLSKDKYLLHYYKKFDSSLIDDIPTMQSAIFKLHAFFKNQDSTVYKNFQKTFRTYCMFESDIPRLAFAYNGSVRPVQDFYSLEPFPELERVVDSLKFFTFIQVEKLIEQGIRNFTIRKNRQHYIGGPIIFLRMQRGNIFTWSKSSSTLFRWQNVCDFRKDYLNRRVKMTFIEPEYKNYLKNMSFCADN